METKKNDKNKKKNANPPSPSSSLTTVKQLEIISVIKKQTV